MIKTLSYGLLAASDDLDPTERDRILSAMAAIEKTAVDGMTGDVDRTLHRLLAIALPLIDKKDVQAIQDLSVGLHLALQRSLFLLAESAWLEGSTHALEEMRSALPPEYQNLNQSQTLSALTDKIKALVFGLFKIVPKNFRNTPAEKAVKDRVLKLAGNFSDDTLERVKGHLLASVVPSPTQGVIDRAELVRRIQGELGVAKARAVTIAQTETGAAYNSGRLATYQESALVTHLKFVSIDDGRTTEICKSRNGVVFEKGDRAALKQCRPPCHYRCRSVLTSLMPSVNEDHQKLVDDPSRRIGVRSLAPLLKGWRSP
jgi:SPP1 gp7 family putative phage head morphogenesis protein